MKFLELSFNLSADFMTNPLDTRREFNVHKTFRRWDVWTWHETFGRLLNVSCAFNLRSVSWGKLILIFSRCNMSDDFGPATSIMNMCFTYYFTSSVVHGEYYFRIWKCYFRIFIFNNIAVRNVKNEMYGVLIWWSRIRGKD